MRYRLLVSVLVMAAVGGAQAQVASHAPTQAASTPRSAAVQGARPVARVNGTVLTERDLLREMYTIFPYARQHGGAFPKAMEPEIRKGALQMIIFEELVYQEALRRHMSIPPAKVSGAMQEFRKQYSESEYKELLQQEFGGSEARLRKGVQRSMLIEQLLKSDVESQAVVSLAEARAFYDKNPGKFQVEESFEFQSISVVPPEHPNPDQQREARKRAQDFLRRAKATKTYQEFGLLAEKISEDDYRVNMGDHHAVRRADLPPQIVQAALAMQPGQVSELIQIEQAYTIFRLNKHTPAGKKGFAEAKDEIRDELRKRKVDQLRAQLGKKLRTGSKVEEL